MWREGVEMYISVGGGVYVSPWVEGKDINVCFCVGEETDLYFPMGRVYASWCMGGTCWCIYDYG